MSNGLEMKWNLYFPNSFCHHPCGLEHNPGTIYIQLMSGNTKT